MSEFDKSFFPISIKVAAQTIDLNLVSVSPMGGNSIDELERIKNEIIQENRDRKIDSLVDNKEFEEMKIEEHPDYNTGPKPKLFYMDYVYGGTPSNPRKNSGPI